MSIQKGHFCKMSDTSEVNNFLSRKACIPIKRIKLKEKCRNPVPVKCSFKSKEEPDRLLHLKSINLVKGYIQVLGVDYT